MNTIPIEHINIDGIRIAHSIAGDGKPILLLHGWGAHIPLVWPLAETLISSGYRCYALDLPGFGESEEPPQAWSVFDYADFVIQYLDSQELEEVYLFGHSFGGRLSLILGAKHSKRIIKMALSDSAGLRPKTPWIARTRLKTYQGIRQVLNSIGLGSISEVLRRQYNQRYGSADFQQVTGIMRETFVKVVNQDLSAYAEQAQPPTLLFWGSEDEDTPLWMGRKLEELMPDAGLIVHEGAGHYAYLERLIDTARVMAYFFQE